MGLIAKTLALGTALFMVGCASTNKSSDASMSIQRGMSYQQVMNVVSGYPTERTFRGRGTAVQFCSKVTWDKVGTYAVVWMVDDEVEGLTQYKRRIAVGVACEDLFREVDWGQAPADVKIALDIR